MTNEQIMTCREMEERINSILESEGFTDEAEALMDRIAYFCIRHQIPVSEYKRLVLGE